MLSQNSQKRSIRESRLRGGYAEFNQKLLGCLRPLVSVGTDSGWDCGSSKKFHVWEESLSLRPVLFSRDYSGGSRHSRRSISHSCASAERSADPCSRDTERSHGSAALPGMHADRSPGNCHAGTRLPADTARALEFFRQHVLQHSFVQRQVGHDLFQPRILFLQLLELADLVHV